METVLQQQNTEIYIKVKNVSPHTCDNLRERGQIKSKRPIPDFYFRGYGPKI